MAGDTTPKIYSAIPAIIKEMKAVAKSNTNKQQGFKYRGIDQVMNAVKPLLAQNGVFFTIETLEREREERTNRNGNTLIYSIVKVRFTFYAEDGSNVSCVTIGEGMDSGDKATNKAMAVALKYALFDIFCIPTGDDPDAESHEVAPKTAKPKQATPFKISFDQCKEELSIIDDVDSVRAWYADMLKKNPSEQQRQALEGFCKARVKEIESNGEIVEKIETA